MRDGFFKAVLAVIDVADVDFQARETVLVAQASEYFSGVFRGAKCLVVFPEQYQRLNGGAQSARSFLPVAQRFVQLEGLLVMRDRRTVVAGGIKRIGLRAQAKR